MFEALVFVVAAIGAIGGAVTVIMAKNPVYSAMGLLGTLFSVAVLYVLQLAHFVAAVQIIVYAGAVLTLFLFVIMLIGVDKEENRDEALPVQRWAVGVIAGLGGRAARPRGVRAGASPVGSGGPTRRSGRR